MTGCVGVSWGEFAERVGVTERGMLKWRRGGPPSGAYLWSIIELARDVPGGLRPDTGRRHRRGTQSHRGLSSPALAGGLSCAAGTAGGPLGDFA